jgi:hypothetical protein
MRHRFLVMWRQLLSPGMLPILGTLGLLSFQIKRPRLVVPQWRSLTGDFAMAIKQPFDVGKGSDEHPSSTFNMAYLVGC